MKEENYSQMTLLGGPPVVPNSAPAEASQSGGLKAFVSDEPCKSDRKLQTLGGAATPTVKKEKRSLDQLLKNNGRTLVTLVMS